MSKAIENNKWAVELLEDNMEGYTEAERKTYLDDVTTHGCISGCVSGVIYYHETEQLFKDNLKDILDTLSEYEEDTGVNPVVTAAEDSIDTLPNKLVWFVVELVAYHLVAELDNKEIV